MAYQITRKLEFDAGHRLVGHESKCANLHGHRYVAEITVEANKLDKVGRVIDFGVVKGIVGQWLDTEWDHGMLLHEDDTATIKLCEAHGWKHYVLDREPTAENLSEHLFSVASRLLLPQRVKVVRVRLYETPNCWADAYSAPKANR